MNGMEIALRSIFSLTRIKRKAHLVDLELPDKCPNILFCHGTAQVPTIPLNLHMLMLIPRKLLEHRLPLTSLHVPARMSRSTQRRRP
jgi:hypothetical protein